MAITYRTPGASDVEALASLGAASFVETFGPLYQPTDLAAFLAQSHTGQAVGQAMAQADTAYQVAETDGALIGYCRIGALDLPVDAALPGAMELKQLYVRKPWQGAGVAAGLMDWAMDAFRKAGAPQVYLSVFSGNGRAQRFYQRYGFSWHMNYHFMVGTHRDEEFIYRLDMAS